MKRKVPTWTSLVTEALRAQDDFMSTGMLARATGANKCQLSAALIHLRSHRVIDVVINPDGKAWWFALPPEGDDRHRTFAEIAAEIKKPNRKPRKPAIKVV